MNEDTGRGILVIRLFYKQLFSILQRNNTLSGKLYSQTKYTLSQTQVNRNCLRAQIDAAGQAQNEFLFKKTAFPISELSARRRSELNKLCKLK